jgi:serine/threonine protein kinase/Tfp pilus assembly protein PilF
MAENAERWHQVRALFEEALDLEPVRRQELLAGLAPDLRSEVEALLGWHEDADEFLEQPPSPPSGLAGETDLQQVGAYRPVELLGQGGMGSVYLAVRADDAYQKRVAVKILGAGLGDRERVARFRAERQILARLDHPNIARLHDGGTTASGRPYLVMEHVDGIPVDAYCDERRLSTADRLRLFLKICSAVRYAHQNLIVHRDLKPANILVTADGEPKLLDFGIAKLLENDGSDVTVLRTEPGLAPLTPRYASPEQVSGGAVTALSDVYALGVLLYELLTGHRPYAEETSHLDEVVRAIRIAEPERPSAVIGRVVERAGGDGSPASLTPEAVSAVRDGDRRLLRRRLEGDLDNVLLMALRKEPQRRYSSVEQLALDLENHLAGRPVRARPDTFFYRTGKLLGRHRLGAAAVTVAALALAGFIVALLVQRQTLIEQRETLIEQRRQLLAERNRAATVSTFLTGVFATPDPTRSRGEAVTARELLDRGVAQIDRELVRYPGARADLLLTMGRSYKNLGLYAEAEPLLLRSLAERRAHTPESAGVAESLHELAELASLAGRYQPAEEWERRSLALRRRLHGDDSAEVVESLGRLARILELRGDYAAAGTAHREVLALARRRGDRGALAKSLDRYAILQSQQGHLEQAEALFREALALGRQAWGDPHPEIALIGNDLALLLKDRGRLDESEALLVATERTQHRLFRGPHPHLVTTLNNFGQLRAEQGRFAEAESLYRASIAMARQVYAGDHPRVAATLQNLGDLSIAQGRPRQAEDFYRQALDIRRRLLPPGHPETAATRNNLARSLAAQGRLADAEAAFSEALRESRATLGESHPQVVIILNNLADVRQSRGDLAGAEELYRRAIDLTRRRLGSRHRDLAPALHNLGSLQQDRGDLAAAEASFRQALAILEETSGRDHLNSAMTRLSLALLLLRKGEPTVAEGLARKSLAVLAAKLPAGDVWVVAAQRAAGQSLAAQQRYAEAEPFLRAVVTAGCGRAAATDLDALAGLYEAWGRPEDSAPLRRQLSAKP